MISYEDYKRLLAEGQKYVTQAQAADPEWQAWQQQASRYTPDMGGAPASPDKDYWSQYMGTLTPDQASSFQKHMADSKSWTDKVGSVLKYAIPAAVGGIGLAGAGGLLAGTELGAAAGFPASGSIFGGTGAAAAAAPAATGVETASTLPLWDTGTGGLFGSQAALDSAATSAGWYPGASMAAGTSAAGNLVLGDLLPAGFQSTLPAAAAGASLLDPSTWSMPSAGDVGGTLGSAAKWAVDNPGLISLLGGTLAGVGAGSSSQSGTNQNQQKQYAPQPGMQMGLLQQPTLNQSPGLFTMGQGQGLANSGLARFGAKGGQFTPMAYQPQSFTWGQR